MDDPHLNKSLLWVLANCDFSKPIKGQGGLACCNAWGRKESDTTERLNWTDVCCMYLNVAEPSFLILLFWLVSNQDTDLTPQLLCDILANRAQPKMHIPHPCFQSLPKRTKEPLDEGERKEWKCWLETQHSIHSPYITYLSLNTSKKMSWFAFAHLLSGL